MRHLSSATWTWLHLDLWWLRYRRVWHRHWRM